MPAGKHREGYSKPRTGERRRQRKPLKLDRYPQAVRDEILAARAAGCTWLEVAERALAAAAKGSGLGGTAPVAEPDNKTLEAWAELCRRWFDIRVEQVRDEVQAQDRRAEKTVALFAGRSFEHLPSATVQALKAEVFGLMEAGTPAQREESLGNFLALLTGLMKAQAAAERVKVEKDKVAIARERLEQMRAKVSGLKEAVAGGKKKVSNEELVKKLDEIYGLTQPNAA